MKKNILLFLFISILITACGQEPTPQPSGNIVIAEPVVGPTATSAPVFSPPLAYKEYIDTVAGISIFIPENWVISESIEGQYAILQSYPVDKYIGGEPFQPGDTKCDLLLNTDTKVDQIIQNWTSGEMATTITDETFILRDGLEGRKLVLDNMGRSLSVFTEINGNAVVFTCYGEFSVFDDIASTLGAISF